MNIRPLLLELIKLPNPTLKDLELELEKIGMEIQLSEVGLEALMLKFIKEEGPIGAALKLKQINKCQPDEATIYVENLIRKYHL